MNVTEERVDVRTLSEEGSFIQAPVRVNMAGTVKIGKNVSIMYNVLMMSRGGVTIEDNAMIFKIAAEAAGRVLC